MRSTPFTDSVARYRAGKFGMRIFLVSLGMLFAASLLGYLIIRMKPAPWPQDLPRLPGALWISTAVLVASSFTMQWALRAARANHQALLRTMMLITTYAGIAFLVIQFRAWLTWLEPVTLRWEDSSGNEYRYALAGFYVLTGLHAAHVIGGLVPLVVVTRNAFRGEYSADYHPGVQYVAMYWHFLDAVWIVLFATLKLSLG